MAKATGLGMALVQSEILRKMPRPWFKTEWQTNLDGKLELAGEDGLFFDAMRSHAFEHLYIDCESSRLIGHVGSKVYKEG